MNYRLASAVAAVLAASPAQVVWAQAASGGLEEVVVTAQRRAESLQDVPLSIQALTGETLRELNVSTIDEFVKFLPSVSTANLGPGQSNIYMRGLSVGTFGTQGTGRTAPGRTSRCTSTNSPPRSRAATWTSTRPTSSASKCSTGPQGTLFGAGAQAGVLRYITNKPEFNAMHVQRQGRLTPPRRTVPKAQRRCHGQRAIIDGKLAAARRGLPRQPRRLHRQRRTAPSRVVAPTWASPAARAASFRPTRWSSTTATSRQDDINTVELQRRPRQPQVADQ